MNALVLALLVGISASARAEAVSLKVMTYNVWGAPFSGKKAKQRIPQIGAKMSPQDHDIVAIQESFEGCFVPNESRMLLRNSGYPYFVNGPKGKGIRCVSAGLLLMSKHPILESDSVIYNSCSGMDCFSRKAVLYARVQVPAIGEVDVYSTHTNAGDHADIRKKQTKQIIDFMKKHSGDGKRPVILMGDFNAQPDDSEMVNLRESVSLRDAHQEFVDTHVVSPVERDGYTADPIRNGNLAHRDDQRLRRIDYVLMRAPATMQMTSEFSGLTFEGHDYRALPLSDHFGVQVEFSFSPY